MYKFKVRADGSREEGLGHLYRCFALLQPFRSMNHEVVYYSRQSAVSFLKENSVQFQIIRNDEEFISSVTAEDIVLVDNYNFDASSYLKLKLTGAKTIVIDDLGNSSITSDILINHAPGAHHEYDRKKIKILLLGPEYALVNPAFASARKPRNVIDEKDNLFLCMGGADPFNLTIPLLKQASPKFSEITVVTGSSYGHQAELTQTLSTLKNATHFHSLSITSVAELMRQHTFALVPSSTILFEALTVGLITYSGFYVDNQKAIYDGFLNLGSIKGLGDISDLNDAQKFFQIGRISDTEKEMILNTNRKIFDGDSIKRIQHAIVSLFE